MPEGVYDYDEEKKCNKNEIQNYDNNEIICAYIVEDVVNFSWMKFLKELSHNKEDANNETQFIVEGLLIDYPSIEEEDIL